MINVFVGAERGNIVITVLELQQYLMSVDYDKTLMRDRYDMFLTSRSKKQWATHSDVYRRTCRFTVAFL